MKASAFVGVSLDGFLARPDGALDFLPSDAGGADTGFEAFFAEVDALVMGRKTFETALGFPAWPYGDKRVVVLSTRPLDARAPPTVGRMQGEPAALVERLEKEGVRHIYVDGGETVRRFLRAGLLDRLTVTYVPVLIGQGVPLFGPQEKDVRARHLLTRTLPGGLVQSTYLFNS